MVPPLQQRVDSMFARDRLMAILFIIGLWCAVGVVYLRIRSLVGDGGVSLALIVSAVLIVAYNTVSLLAMISHYRQDKNWIYEIDIRHLDEADRNKTGGAPPSGTKPAAG